MNEPGETTGYTLAKHVNEVERYLGKQVLDYVIANNGEITEELLYQKFILNEEAKVYTTPLLL